MTPQQRDELGRDVAQKMIEAAFARLEEKGTPDALRDSALVRSGTYLVAAMLARLADDEVTILAIEDITNMYFSTKRQHAGFLRCDGAIH